jgi:hypothetical protein
MQGQGKKTKKRVKIDDLKPAKDPKGVRPGVLPTTLSGF